MLTRNLPPGARALWLLLGLLVSQPALSADPNELAAEAQTIAKTQLARFGKGYEARIDPQRRLVFITALDPEHFKATAGLLAAFTDAWRKTLPADQPSWNITIILPTADHYKPLAPSKDIPGFYRPSDHTLISIDRGRVLLHEFTHALHDADCGKSAQATWVIEGLATLFEACEINAEGVRPLADLSLLTLQKAIRQKKEVPLEQLLRLDPEGFRKNAQLCYAESRYLMLYLYEQKLLPKWYQAYRTGCQEDPTGLKALEKVCGKRVFQVEDDWTEWLSKQKPPWGELRSGQARLGAELHDDPKGPKVVGLTPGSASERAGRIKVGDTIVKFNGRDVSNVAELVGAIRVTGAMQTVAIELIRDGLRVTIQQPLGGADAKEPPGAGQ
jgi:hypothetical protein